MKTFLTLILFSTLIFAQDSTKTVDSTGIKMESLLKNGIYQSKDNVFYTTGFQNGYQQALKDVREHLAVIMMEEKLKAIEKKTKKNDKR